MRNPNYGRFERRIIPSSLRSCVAVYFPYKRRPPTDGGDTEGAAARGLAERVPSNVAVNSVSCRANSMRRIAVLQEPLRRGNP
jgi:hypothetical protein